jgi:DNA phosphorothioation-associated putative methyltransferase
MSDEEVTTDDTEGRAHTGKRVGSTTYWHRSAIPAQHAELVAKADALASEHGQGWSVLKLDDDLRRFSLLDYPTFFEDAFPHLAAALAVDLDTGRIVRRRFAAGSNRPVLHRKELLLSPGHPQAAAFAETTARAEAAGLFADTAIIGHEWQWEEELAARGFRVAGNALLAADEGSTTPAVMRFRTALSRSSLSTPVQALWRHGLVSGRTFFDYGCGRGDDLAALTAAGVDATGWDPHFRVDGTKREADVVNLGFVLNVIEDPVERRAALAGAWRLARRILSVAVLIGGRTAWERHRLHADGVLTSRSTFQKYFAPDELLNYVEGVTGRQPVPVAPGLVFVFRDDADEQAFLRSRLSGYGARQDQPVPRRERPPRPERAPRVRAVKLTKWALNEELLAHFWNRVLELGRLPELDEFAQSSELAECLGSPRRVLAYLLETKGRAEFDDAAARRGGELLAYLALLLFERRRSASALSTETRRDISAFHGSLSAAMDAARALLFSTGSAEQVSAACRRAAEEGLGYYEPGEGLHVVGERIHRLPSLLRVYIGCAEKLYGDAAEADVCKIHDGTGKLSLLHYDDFWGRPIPRLVERVKIDLRRLRIDFFEYDGIEFKPSPLYLKSRWMTEGDPYFDEQAAFDAALRKVPGLDLTGHGPSADELDRIFEAHRLAIKGWRLIKRRASRSQGT